MIHYYELCFYGDEDSESHAYNADKAVSYVIKTEISPCISTETALNILFDHQFIPNKEELRQNLTCLMEISEEEAAFFDCETLTKRVTDENGIYYVRENIIMFDKNEQKQGTQSWAKTILTDLMSATTLEEKKAILYRENSETLREMLLLITANNSESQSAAMMFQKSCYTKYQLYWMQTHQKSLHDFLTSILHTMDLNKAVNADEILQQWESDQGFDGELYACESEFLDTEFQDKDFMRQLLSKTEYNVYTQYQNT